MTNAHAAASAACVTRLPARTEASPFATPAHRYLGRPSRDGRDMALDAVTEALRIATDARPVVRMHEAISNGRSIATTRLELSDGSTATHSAWHRSFDGVVLEVRIAGGRHGDCTVEIRTGLDDSPDSVSPDHGTEDAALTAALRTMECMRLHLHLSSTYPAQDDDEQDAAAEAEALAAAALARDPLDDDMVHVRRATPWSPLRVLDSERHRDLLDADGLAAMPGGEAVLSVCAHADGSHARIEWVGRFVDAHDPLSRLRTLAAMADRTPAATAEPQSSSATNDADAHGAHPHDALRAGGVR